MSEAQQSEGSGSFDVRTTEAVQLSENIVEDLVDYSRGNIIKNEPQAVLTYLGWLSGWMAEEERYINNVLIGTSSGGKTHVTRKMKALLPENSYYTATSGSDKSFIDDDSWNRKNVAILSEFQKIGADMREFMKSVSGGDEGYEYARSVSDDSDGASRGDRTTQKIQKDAKPYSFTYAAFSMDFEMANRLFFNYIDEGPQINRAVARMHSGHSNITLQESEYDYIYDTDGLELALKRHHREIPDNSYTHIAEWIFYAYEDTLDLKRSESKRFSAMIPNLMRTSALLNHENRPTIEDEVSGRTIERVVVLPQDVANILACRRVLLGTTHEYEPRKQSIVNAVRAHTEMSDWCRITDIQSWLDSNGAEMSRLKKDQLRELLRELSEDFIIEISENHYEGRAHGYRFISLSDLGSPKLVGFNESRIDYESDTPLLGVDNPDAPFEDCTDPFKGIPFTDSVERFQNSLKRSINTSSAYGSSSDDSGSSGNNSGTKGQATIGGNVTHDTTITDPIEAVVYEQVRENADGCTFEENVEHEHILGLVNMGENVSELDVEGTLLDPDHDCWTYEDGSRRANSPSEARRLIETAFESLFQDGVIEFTANDDGTGTIHVDEVDVEV